MSFNTSVIDFIRKDYSIFVITSDPCSRIKELNVSSCVIIPSNRLPDYGSIIIKFV